MNGFSNSVVLLGCKQCGKTTHGQLLAKKENIPFYDTDNVIEQISGQKFADYYKQMGFMGLMNDEAVVCKKIADRIGENKAVIATTAHICDNPLALQELRRIGVFVALQLDMDYVVKQAKSKIQKDEAGKFINLPRYIAVHKPKTMNQITEIIVAAYQEKYTQLSTIADTVVKLKNAPIETNFQLLLKAL